VQLAADGLTGMISTFMSSADSVMNQLPEILKQPLQQYSQVMQLNSQAGDSSSSSSSSSSSGGADISLQTILQGMSPLSLMTPLAFNLQPKQQQQQQQQLTKPSLRNKMLVSQQLQSLLGDPFFLGVPLMSQAAAATAASSSSSSSSRTGRGGPVPERLLQRLRDAGMTDELVGRFEVLVPV
jgi:hypothetical protein